MVAHIVRSVSLVRSVLPQVSSLEGKLIQKATVPKAFDQKPDLQGKHHTVLKLTQLFLLSAKETALAITNSTYKDFDALIKNFGCQITALEVHRLLVTGELQLLAPDMLKIADEKLNIARSIRKVSNRPGQDLPSYALELGLDFEIDERLARLIRLHLLSIVNTNIVKYGREIPQTDCSRINQKVRKIDHKILKALISGLQAEESILAADYVEGVSMELLSIEIPRAPILQRALHKSLRRSSKGSAGQSAIISLSLLHNAEVSIRGLKEGIILVKNKLKLLEKDIAGAVDCKIFLDAQTFRLLDADEIRALDPREPLYVIEGYIKDKNALLKHLQTDGGLIELVNANTAQHPAFASNTSQHPIDDVEVQADIDQFAAQKYVFDAIFEIDHVFCSSVEVERV